jgi:hypothetical protein
MGATGKGYRTLVGRTRVLENNIKMGVREIGLGDVK